MKLEDREAEFLKQIGKRLVRTGVLSICNILDNEKEQIFYLECQATSAIPILRGYAEESTKDAFDKRVDFRLSDDWHRAESAKEAVRALSIVKKIAEKREDKSLVDKVNEEIISVGDRANRNRPEYAFPGGNKNIEPDAVIFAYKHAEGTSQRMLEFAEATIESDKDVKDYMLEKIGIEIYSSIDATHANRIAGKLNKGYQTNPERVLQIASILYKHGQDLFNALEKSLNKELLARVKFPGSRITEIDGKIIAILDNGKKLVVMDDTEKEFSTKSA